ncbi:MAG: sigma-E processing peptidase SpoIIGA [Christensenellales bacterium]
MVIWIEQVLIDNFVINLLIFLSLKAILRAKIKNLNIVLSSLLGSLVAVILPVFRLYFVFNSLIKILLSLVMVLNLKKWQKMKEFVLYWLTFLLLTCLFGGVCLFLLLFFDKNFSPSNYSSYSLPLGAICVIALFMFLVVKNIFKNFYKRKTLNNFVFRVVLYNAGKSDEIVAFLDSGNNLTDSLTNKPITVVDFKCLKNVAENLSITDIILNKQTKLNQVFKNAHVQKTQSIGRSESTILVVEVERMEIYSEKNVHIINEAVIGLTLKSFVSGMGYSALLNPNLM